MGLDHRRFELLERQGGNVERRGWLRPSAQALQHDGGVAPPQRRLERVGEIDDFYNRGVPQVASGAEPTAARH
ncbi:MAG: hypothetical protein ACJ76Q_07690 [Solirubrobacteraceae bacterium]